MLYIYIYSPAIAATPGSDPSSPAAWFAAIAASRSSWLTWICLEISSNFCAVVTAAALVLVRPALSVCWMAKQPPKGPAKALFLQRTVQTLPVEPVFIYLIFFVKVGEEVGVKVREDVLAYLQYS